MLNKLKRWLFTVNLTFLLTLNLFAIIAAVLLITAGAGWFAAHMGRLDWTALLSPSAVMIIIYAVSILIGVSMVVMIQSVILRPVRGMVAAMKRLEQGDFAVRMTCRGWMRPLELREFTAAFNKAAEELGSTEMLRRDFINNFSHEFKTPITSIGGFADLLLEDEEMPAAERREYLSIISEESKRLAALADRVLTLSRLDTQTFLPGAASFPLAEQLRQSAMMVQQKWARKKSIVLEVDIPRDDACMYWGSEALLKEVWVNLLDNAFKFSSPGGRVALTLRRGAAGPVITVADHGPGMDEETQARLFEQFYQADTSHQTEGNGLGLAIAKKIVDLHHGRITVTSTSEHGSSFAVWLPYKKEVPYDA